MSAVDRRLARQAPLVALWLGCAHTMPHDFDPAGAQDFRTHALTLAGDGAPSCVLLLPRHVHLERLGKYEQGTQSDIEWPGQHVLFPTVAEQYEGPARVYLTPGQHAYVLVVETPAGAVNFDLNANWHAGSAYEIVITESADEVSKACARVVEQRVGDDGDEQQPVGPCSRRHVDASESSRYGNVGQLPGACAIG